MQLALAAGVTINTGGDVGVFPHGDNVREMEMMVDYGMTPMATLQSTTSVNAKIMGWADRLGSLKPGLWADLCIVAGRPDQDISDLRKVKGVIKGGKWVVRK